MSVIDAHILQDKQSLGLALPIMEQFYTLQGEGYHQGKASYFIRTAGCDVGCVWCDVKESWDRSKHPVIAIEDIIAQATVHPAKTVIITGGEPLMHELGPLTAGLKAMGFSTHIETSGTAPLSGEWDWVCFSPKKYKQPLAEIYRHTDELKVIIYHPSDLSFAESFVEKMPAGCQFFLQPEWSKKEKIMPLIVDYVQAHPYWRMGLQMHKYLGIP